MSTVGTFGGFTAARLGIYASQKALEVTGNNISNINTTGYTRQRLDQLSLKVGASDRYHAQYDTQVGQGVLTVSVSQIRDPYLDIRYRTESATLGYTETTQAWLSDVQAILDEVGDGDDEQGRIYAQLEQIETALRNYSDFAGEAEYDTQVRNACESLIFQLNEAARKLNTTRDNAIASLEDQVEGVNEILTQIRDLNIQIRKSDIHGDNALEMRDKRNVLIDQLSTYMDIDVIYTEESFGPGTTVEKLTIKLGNANPDPSVNTDEALLVDGAYCAQFSIDQVPENNPMYDADDMGFDFADFINGQGLTDDEAAGRINEINNRLANVRAAAETFQKLEEPDPDDAKAVKEYEDALEALEAAKADVFNALEAYGINKGNMVVSNEGIIVDNPETQLKYLNEKGEPCDVQDADKVNDEYYRMTVSELRDKNDQVLKIKKEDGAGGFYYADSQPVSLDDNDLYGALQALREFLTEEGEFASEEEIAEIDENAATKRGIPYFQKSLDLLARKFADTFNEANQDYLCNEDGDYIDLDGNVIECPSFDENGNPDYKLENDHIVYKDLDGTVYIYQDGYYVNQDDPTDTGKYVDNGNGILKNKDDPSDTITVSGVPDPDTATKINKYSTLTDEQKEWLANEAAKGLNEDGTTKPGYPVAMGGVLFSNSGDSDDPSYITAENISVSISWASDVTQIVRSFVQPSKLANMEDSTDGDSGEDSVASTDNLNILHMISLLDQTMTYNPQDWTDAYGNSGHAASSVLVKADFNEMMNNIGTVLGNDMRNAEIKYDTSNTALTDLDMARDSVSAVDLNDEAMNLMQYSQSYSAACRLMTTLDDVLDKLINNTGVTR